MQLILLYFVILKFYIRYRIILFFVLHSLQIISESVSELIHPSEIPTLTVRRKF
jgi:hypothetical protein